MNNGTTSPETLLAGYKDNHIARRLLADITAYTKRVSIMEVCGTHTVSLFKTGIKAGLPDNINLVSGPGCPVCVTPVETIEEVIGLACRKDAVLFCFGDMLRVPGAGDSLETVRAKRDAAVKIMYSPMEALEFARRAPDKKTILFGVGFETTVPLFASVLLRARQEEVKNLYLLSAFKLIPPAIDSLLAAGNVTLDGFMLPGHVSSIIGADVYRFMAEKYGVPGVVTGFEVVDILAGISGLLELIAGKQAAIKNCYPRFVKSRGNLKAVRAMQSVFTPSDARWRGLGMLPASGLALRDDFAHFDARQLIDFHVAPAPEPGGCRCGDVIKGICIPPACPLYKKTCTPSQPIGPCMVSSEGTCAAYYKYGG